MSGRSEGDKFVSRTFPVPGAQTAVWVVGTLGITPAAGRTDGRRAEVRGLEIANVSGVAAKAWIETLAGLKLCVDISIAADDTVLVDWPDGKNMGDQDIYLNADVDGMSMSISGREY